MIWTDERKAQVARLWAQTDPQLSASQIAERMGGVSRNSVISIVHRMLLPGRASPIRNNGCYDTRPIKLREGASEPRKHRAKPAAEKKLVVQPPQRPWSPFRSCQWIDGLPSADDSCKCLAPTVPGRPYCQAHEARAYSRRAA